MQIFFLETISMKCQNLFFPGKIRKNIISLLSTESANRLVKVFYICFHCIIIRHVKTCITPLWTVGTKDSRSSTQIGTDADRDLYSEKVLIFCASVVWTNIYLILTLKATITIAADGTFEYIYIYYIFNLYFIEKI